MRRLLLFFTMTMFVAAGLFAVGTDETISLAGGRGYIDELTVAFPGVEFSVVDMDHTTGENITMAALVAGGTPPDVYVGFAGRAGMYLVPEFALPLDVDESVWDQAVLDTYKHGGVLYGLPFSLPVQGMAINTDVTDAAGYDIPDGPWTIFDYLEMLEAIQNSGYEGDPTYLYAGTPSADYFWLGYFGAFGIDLFDEGYTRSTFNDTEAGVEVMTFLKYVKDQGYSPENTATNTVNEILTKFADETVATTGFRPNWIPDRIKSAVDKAIIDEPFNYIVKPFPVKPGVAWPAPIPGVGTCVLAHKTDDLVKAQLLMDIVVFIAGIAQDEAWGDILTRNDISLTPGAVEKLAADPFTAEIIDYTYTGGYMDPGYTYEWYGETRECALPILRDLYNGVTTPEEAAQQYEEAVNAILEEYR